MCSSDLVEIIAEAYAEETGTNKQIVWDTSKPNGDLLRCLDSTKQKTYGILPTTTLKDGIKKIIKHLKVTHG